MIQIHRASAVHLDNAEVVLNWEERGTIKSRETIAQAMKAWKSRWEATQKSLPVELYLHWLEQKKAVHSYNTITSICIHTGHFSFTHCTFDTFQSLNGKTGEVENAMVHASRRRLWSQCELAKVPWSSFKQGGRFSVSAGVRFRFWICGRHS